MTTTAEALPHRRYSMLELSSATNIGVKTLRSWRRLGWLIPSAKVGTREKFTMAAFEAACDASVSGRPAGAEPVSPAHDPDWATKAAYHQGY